MNSFEILLKNDKIGSYKKIGYLIFCINFIFFIFYAFYSKQGYERFLWIIFAILIPAFCFGELFIYKKLRIKKSNISITYCWLILLWSSVSILMMTIHISLLVFDSITKRKLQVNFNTSGIVYPSFPKKNIQWDVLSNVILKDGLLTIDFKNNHLLQSEIETTNNKIDETVFNHFCQLQINHS